MYSGDTAFISFLQAVLYIQHPKDSTSNSTYRFLGNYFYMSFNFENTDGDVAIVHVGKALDFRNAAEFKSGFQEQIEAGIRRFILDFSDTGILDSTGLGSIFSLYRQISPDDGQVVFASVSRPVQVVVQLTRTYKVFKQYPSVDEAREAFE